jgi:hypothetical protein
LQLQKFSYAVLHSTTILLPIWYDTLQTLGLNERIMPRDVTTCWNLTHDMLVFAVEYWKAISAVTTDQDNNLRQYKLTRAEWEVVEQLTTVLKVR